MKTILAIISLSMLALDVSGASRILNQYVNTLDPAPTPQVLPWYQGESITYAIKTASGTGKLVATNSSAYWSIVSKTNSSLQYVAQTGTIDTNGNITFTLTPTQSYLPVSSYDSIVNMVTTNNNGTTNSLIVVSRSVISVMLNWMDGSSNVVPTILPEWGHYFVSSNQMGSGSAWNGSQWVFGAGSIDLSWSNDYYRASNPSNYITSADIPADDLAWQSNATDAIARATNTAQDIVIGGKADTNDVRLTDSRAPLAHQQPLSTITNAGSLAYSNSLTAADVGAATSAQGALADGAVQTNGYGGDVAVDISLTDTNTLIVSGAGGNRANGVYTWSSAQGAYRMSTLSTIYFQNSRWTMTNVYGEPYRNNSTDPRDVWSLYAGGVAPAPTVTYGPVTNTANQSFLMTVSEAVSNRAQDALIASKLDTNGSGASLTDLNLNPSLTDTVAKAASALSTNGGTVNGPVYTTIDHATMSPSDQEFATAGWVRDLFPVTATYYSTSNDNTVVTGLGFTCRTLTESIPPISSGVFTTGLTNAGYLAAIATTNKVNATGTVVINAYISAVGANPSPSLTLHPEIYATGDGTNLYGDWEAQNQVITLGGTTNPYTFVIPIGSITNSYVVRRWKIGSANNITSIRFHNGTNATVNTASRMGITVAASADTYELTAAKIADAGGLTNVSINGTSFTVVNGVATGTTSPTNGYYNLLPIVSAQTCTVLCAYGERVRIAPTGTVYFTAGTCLTDTNTDATVAFSLFYNAQTFGFVGATMTNTATLTSNAWNDIIFRRGYGQTILTGK